MKTSSKFTPNENTPTIAFVAKPGLIPKENSSPLITRPVGRPNPWSETVAEVPDGLIFSHQTLLSDFVLSVVYQ
ncbi:hypothetical protein TNCV_1788411 [Trichonephila clavipes]|nr:hypothetical protein TNCV_1788411 [Trichonephila clavipes]